MMYPGSTQESESDHASKNDTYNKPKTRKKVRKKNSTPSTPSSSTAETKRPALDRSDTENNVMHDIDTKSNEATIQPNTAHKRNLLTFQFTYTIPTYSSTTRIQLTTEWARHSSNTQDISIKKHDHFLLKTNNPQASATLLQLQRQNLISAYNSTAIAIPTQPKPAQASTNKE
ncbi:hypothetical protein ABEB36_000316 [Hypothenemus hampei]|uniref:Uncharacterized protein n=1 Tax=Hypothenemus hampei TaxID=57062 RepID=A0ABD1FCS5_HYPHA